MKNINNKGFSLVVVIIVMAIVGVMASVIMIMATNNFQMSQTDKNSKNNFYMTENVLDQIQSGISEDVVICAEKAYVKAIQEYALPASAQSESYYAYFLAFMEDVLESPFEENTYYIGNYEEDGGEYDSSTGLYSLGIARYLAKESANDYKNGILKLENTAGSNSLVLDGNTIVLKGLRITYEDSRGYYNRITTDICIDTPELKATRTADAPEISNYCIIADNLIFKTTQKTKITGNIVVNENIEMSASSVEYEDIDNMAVGKNLIIGDVTGTSNVTFTNTNVWANKILINGDATKGNVTKTANLSSNANTSFFIKEGLSVKGHNSKIVLQGNYYGYGKNTGNITINGTNNVLNLNDVSILSLNSTAYIQATNYGETEDIPLGTSVGTKLDQIVFMVPIDVLEMTNPCLATDYAVWNKKLNITEEINETGHSLSDYGLEEDDYSVIFKTSSAGESICYLFLDFSEKEEMAKKYYCDYIRNNSEFERYYELYQNELIMPDNESVYEVSAKGQLIEFKKSVGLSEYLRNEFNLSSANEMDEKFSDSFACLTAKLTSDGTQLAPGELSKKAYDNLIQSTAVDMIPGSVSYENGEIIVANNSSGVPITVGSLSSNSACKLLIANGDVLIKGNFSGLIISGGNITVASGTGTLVSSDQSAVYQLLQTVLPDNTAFAAKYLKNSSAYVEDTQVINSFEWVKGMVSYRNWKRE